MTSSAARPRILVVDDDAGLTASLELLLGQAGYDVSVAHHAAGALVALRQLPTHLVLLDLRLGRENGLDLLPELKAIRRELSVVVFTALGTIDGAVEAMQKGADNFLVKPVDPARLLAVVAKGVEARALRQRSFQMERLQAAAPVDILGASAGMTQALKLAHSVAGRDTLVLITGETGTGKGLLARHLHQLSERRAHAFVPLNCAGLNRDLTESELFGHERGAFTGANERKLGLFEAADGGTLFLDELGEMDLAVQARLLKVLDEGRFRRVGGTAELSSNARLVAATHRNLAAEVQRGTFRQDLFYRINTFTIELPPLRARPQDILPLAQQFLCLFAGPHKTLTSEAAEDLLDYRWPGNVRELRNVMERAAILSPLEAPVDVEHLPALLSQPAADEPDPAPSPEAVASMRDNERALIETALRAHQGNIRAVARVLGTSRGTIYRKIKTYNIAWRAP